MIERIIGVVAILAVVGAVVLSVGASGLKASDPEVTVQAKVGSVFEVVLEAEEELFWVLLTVTDKVAPVSGEPSGDGKMRILRFEGIRTGNLELEFALVDLDYGVQPGDRRVSIPVEVR